MYHTIVVPLDGSAFAERAVPHAAAIARRAPGCRLHLVRIHQSAPARVVEMARSGDSWDTWDERARAIEARYLEKVAGGLRRQGLAVSTEVQDGPVDRRLATDARPPVDLVVMATHARHGLRRAWLGSVGASLLLRARVPVLLVGPGPAEVGVRHVLAAAGGAPAGEAAALEAARVAGLFGASLTLLHVVTVHEGIESPYDPRRAAAERQATEERLADARDYLSHLTAGFPAGTGADVHVVREYGPADGILRAVRECRPDLLVLGTRRRHRLGRALRGSVADTVIRAAPCPTLVVHAPWRRRPTRPLAP